MLFHKRLIDKEALKEISKLNQELKKWLKEQAV
jgi:hypothetical protein